MTGPRPEDVSSLAATSGWDDERLAAAFAGSSARVIVPVDLAAVTVERLRPAAHPVPWWRRVLPAGAVALLLVVVIGGGFAILGGSSGLLWGEDEDALAFREGPTPDLRTLDAGSFALDFPADWHGYDATGPYQGTALAVLSSMPIPCRDGGRLDITCVYERPLEPGEARIIVGQEAYRESTVVDRPDVENATTTRTTLGGMPAIVDTFDVESEGDFYAADAHVRWSIAMPESLSHVVVLDAMVREPGLPEAQLASHSMIESFRFTPPPAPPSVEPTATVSPSVEPSPTPTPTPSTLPSPSAPGWGPWPPDGATVIELPTNDERIPRVAVVDRSGELTEVRAPTAVDGSPEGPSEGFYRDPTDASQYRLRWTTTICDREMLITIEEDIARIVIEHAPRDGCDAMAVGRELVFEFSRDVDPAEVELVVNRAVLLPADSESGVPSELFGLDTIGVDAALAIQAVPDDDREIAVRGWIWRLDPATTDCALVARTDIDELFFGEGCHANSLMATEDGTFDGPFLRLTAASAIPHGSLPFGERVQVVLVGHFDDRRSVQCSASLMTRCADMFWIDAVWMEGETSKRDHVVDRSDGGGDQPIGTAAAAAAAATSILDDDPTRTMPRDGYVLAVRLMPGNHLFGIEPTLTPYCGPNCDFAVQVPEWVWHVTVLDLTLDRVRTFVIDDAEFGDQRPVTMQEPTVDGSVEHTETAAAPEPRIILGMRLGAYPYVLEEVDLPAQMP